MPTRPVGNISKLVVEIKEQTEELAKKGAIDHERISVLEKYASNMSGLPARVDALGQQVIALDKSMIREVDGLREQQKAHQTATADNMAAGFESITKKVESSVTAISDKVEAIVTAISNKVDGLVKGDTIRKGIWQFVQTLGQCALGGALLAEAVKAVFGH